jgi:hypothetical protein
MQAGWPSASVFPRGGLQGGGGLNNINSFNLALVNKTGKTTHFRGRRNQNLNSNNAMNTNSNMNNNSMNSNNLNNNNMNSNTMNNNMNSSTMNNNNNNNNNTNMNNNNSNNNNTNTFKTNKSNMTKKAMAAKKIVYKGKRYYSNSKGDVFTRSNNGEMGPYVGKLVRSNNGTSVLNTSIPQESPPDLETMNNSFGSNRATPLSQEGGSMPVCGSCPFPGTGYCDFYARGGAAAGGAAAQSGGGCGCSAGLFKGGARAGGARKGGYRPTKKNLKALKKWRKGESIGFTMTSSLKAKGLIPRTSRKLKGKRVISRKYR